MISAGNHRFSDAAILICVCNLFFFVRLPGVEDAVVLMQDNRLDSQ